MAGWSVILRHIYILASANALSRGIRLGNPVPTNPQQRLASTRQIMSKDDARCMWYAEVVHHPVRETRSLEATHSPDDRSAETNQHQKQRDNRASVRYDTNCNAFRPDKVQEFAWAKTNMTRHQVKPKRKPRNCSTRDRYARLGSLDAIIADYLANYSDNADRELQFYRRQRTFEEAVKHAALARLPSGKRANHQRRLSTSTLNSAWAALMQCEFNTCHNFHDLFCLIKDAVQPIHGIGELYVYDTALRIGAFLQLVPDRVYLHAGVRVGARALGFSGGDFILCSDLPTEFTALQPHEIEDCLCIYKRDLEKLNGTKRFQADGTN